MKCNQQYQIKCDLKCKYKSTKSNLMTRFKSMHWWVKFSIMMMIVLWTNKGPTEINIRIRGSTEIKVGYVEVPRMRNSAIKIIQYKN